MVEPELPRLSAELERLALRALRDAYFDANATYFGRVMKLPVLALVDARSRLGRWLGSERTLEIARSVLVEHGWGVVVEVLKHEMAHQFVDEVLGLSDEVAHGPAFRQVCLDRGIDPSASGIPLASADAGDHRMLDRIAKLLALAESSNEHEAQAAMAAAQRLMLKHNIESVTRRTRASHTFRHLGVPTGRVSEAERLLAVIIGDHFFVQAIWVPVWRPLEGKRGSVLEACGTLENVELAEYVHAFLRHTAERLWKDYKRAHGVKSNAERRTFLAGVMSGFRDKLNRAKKAHEREGLVWVGDGDLGDYFRRRHPRVRWARYCVWAALSGVRPRARGRRPNRAAPGCQARTLGNSAVSARSAPPLMSRRAASGSPQWVHPDHAGHRPQRARAARRFPERRERRRPRWCGGGGVQRGLEVSDWTGARRALSHRGRARLRRHGRGVPRRARAHAQGRRGQGACTAR